MSVFVNIFSKQARMAPKVSQFVNMAAVLKIMLKVSGYNFLRGLLHTVQTLCFSWLSSVKKIIIKNIKPKIGNIMTSKVREAVEQLIMEYVEYC